MMTVFRLDEEETKEQPRWTPVVIEGGRELPPENWLKELKPRTMFYCRRKPFGDAKQVIEMQKSPAVEQFWVLHHGQLVTILLSNLNSPAVKVPVISLNFSRMMDWIETGLDGDDIEYSFPIDAPDQAGHQMDVNS